MKNDIKNNGNPTRVHRMTNGGKRCKCFLCKKVKVYSSMSDDTVWTKLYGLPAHLMCHHLNNFKKKIKKSEILTKEFFDNLE